MIANAFSYYRPDNLPELSDAMQRLNGKSRLIYAGGSEIISMARSGSIAPDAVIDIKAIREFQQLALRDGWLHIGAAVTLAQITESKLFPLLGATAARIADHTNQCRITVGGNVAGTITYREAVLPLLLADANVTLFRENALRQAPLRSVFDRRLRLGPDEALVGFQVAEKYLSMPWAHAKRTRGTKIDYPLVTIAAVKTPDGLRFALSGACDYPFRDESLESIFSDASKSAADRAQAILSAMPPLRKDAFTGTDYRAFQTRIALEDAINRLEGTLSC